MHQYTCPIATLIGLLLVLTTSSHAVPPHLLKDIEPANDWVLDHLTAIDDNFYMTEPEEGGGERLWRFDESWLNYQLSLTTGEFLPVDDFIYNMKPDGVETILELYDPITNTAIDLATFATARSLTRIGSAVFFAAESGGDGVELWASLGTPALTYRVHDANPTGDASPDQLTIIGGSCVYVADDGSFGRELWSSDGTSGGTSMVRDIVVGPGDSNILELAAAGGVVYFSASSSTHGREPWVSNGTLAGTHRLMDIIPGSDGSNPRDFIELGGFVFFSADNGVNGRELWVTNGTESGTQLLRDIAPDAASSSPAGFVKAGGSLVFRANDGATGAELWSTDGTFSGTVQLADINSGPSGSAPRDMTSVDGTLYFVADDGTHGSELWATDGTVGGEWMVADIRTGVDGSLPEMLIVARNELWFMADDGIRGRELWASDGTEDGTQLELELGKQDSNPLFLAEFNGEMYVAATTSADGVQLWATNGSEAGTRLVSDQWTDSARIVKTGGVLGGWLYFIVQDGIDSTLWKTNGTTTGTEVVDPALDIGFELAVFDEKLFFRCGNGTEYELCYLDPAETLTVIDLNPAAPGSWPSNFVEWGGELYFTAKTDSTGEELWKTNGTAAGTNLVFDAFVGPDDGDPRNLTPAGPLLAFTATSAAHGTEVFATNGTVTSVRDIRPGPDGSDPRALTYAGSSLYFAADDGISGYELFRVDASGSHPVKDINPGPDGSSIFDIVEYDGLVYLNANDGVSGDEPWVSNGTDAGTTRLADLHPTGDAHPRAFAVHDGRLLFSATLPETDAVYIYDGEELRSVWDVKYGPIDFLPLGDILLTTADDGYYGRELWAFDTVVSIGDTGSIPDVAPWLSATPNPMRGASIVGFDAPAGADAVVDVFDVAGRRVRALFSGRVDDSGHTRVPWDGSNDAGRAVTEGVYFVRVVAGGAPGTRKVLVIR